MRNTNLSDLICNSVQDVNKTIGNEYAIVSKVNLNKTVNLRLSSAPDNEVVNVPVVVVLDLEVGDTVVVSFMNNSSMNPVVVGMLNPRGV